MSIFLTIIAVIVIFSMLVLAHEAGHYFAAKRAGVKVLEFGFGFPPRLFGRKKGETLYSINAIPFGGFVRLYGEDSSDPKALKSRRSFSHQTPWTRTKIIVAGVLMNFLLAYLLLVIGFTFGIQPLILNEQDLFSAISQGVVDVQPGIFVKHVEPGSVAEKAGLGDKLELLTVNGKPVTTLDQVALLEHPEKDADVQFRVMGTVNAHLALLPKGKNFGLTLAPTTLVPHPVVLDAGKKLFAAFEKGDVILSADGQPIYTPAQALLALSQGTAVQLQVLRKNQVQELYAIFAESPRVLIEEVFPGSAAAKSGFQSGDRLLSIDTVGRNSGGILNSPQEVQSLIQNSKGAEMNYHVVRDGKEIVLKARTDGKNVLGISLNSLVQPVGQGLALYQGSTLTSLTTIHDLRLPFGTAITTAWTEMWRLAGLTAESFGRTLKNIFTKFEVPQDIGGPVQIAYYTHAFLQEGFFALLRFTAVLSLSLAVINILPIPALDGGRFLFVIIEAIFKKRVNARFEYYVHSIGFIVLMVLILLVTYSDIVKLF